MNILTVFTGGTIASSITNGSISPVQNQGGKSVLLTKFFERFPEYKAQINFDCRFTLNKLSENMTPNDWEVIVRELYNTDLSQYGAVFITHGSDTLAYFAAMLSVVFGNCKTPIFVIASDKVLDDDTANGLINLKAAADAALSEKLLGVWVPYKNSDKDEATLHRGYQIVQSQILGANFYSLQAKQFCTDKKPLSFKDNVIVLKCFVGADFSRINIKSGDQILLELYHGATAPLCAVAKLADRAKAAGAEMYAASLTGGAEIYETTAELINAGVKFFTDLTLETAYAVLLAGCEKEALNAD